MKLFKKTASQPKAALATLMFVACVFTMHAQWLCEDGPHWSSPDSATLSDGSMVMIANQDDGSGGTEWGVRIRDIHGNWQDIDMISNAAESFRLSWAEQIEVSSNDEIYVGGEVRPDGKGNQPPAVMIRKGVWDGSGWRWETVDYYTGPSKKANTVIFKDMEISDLGEVAWLGKSGGSTIILRSSFSGDSGTWQTPVTFQEYTYDISFDFDPAGLPWILTSTSVTNEVRTSKKGKTEYVNSGVLRLWSEDASGEWVPTTIYEPVSEGVPTKNFKNVDLKITNDGNMVVAGDEQAAQFVFEYEFVILSSTDGGLSWIENQRIDNGSLLYGDMGGIKIYQDSNGFLYFPGKYLLNGDGKASYVFTDAALSNWSLEVPFDLEGYGRIRSMTSNANGLLATFSVYNYGPDVVYQCSAAFLPW